MINLIVKDILIQKRTLIISLLYGVFFMLTFKGNIGISAAYIAGTVTVSYFFIVYACGYEDKYGGFTIFTSLPVKRRDIVISKYLSIFVFTIIGMVFMFFIQIGLSALGLLDEISSFSIETAVGGLMSVCLLGAVYYPFYFKMGYMKSKFIVFIFFMAIGFLPAIVVKVFDKTYVVEKIKQIITRMDGAPDLVVGGALMGCALIILLISMMISVKIFNSKEL